MNSLKPAEVFKFFAEINRIPRPSKKEERMIAYLEQFARERGLECKVDETGNVLIRKGATPGMENRKTVILQSHMDMVCEKNREVEFDFEKDAIRTLIDGDWLRADDVGCRRRDRRGDGVGLVGRFGYCPRPDRMCVYP